MESLDFICAMLQSALPLSCVSQGHLRSAKHGARHDLFSFPCFYQPSPLGARSLLQAFALKAILIALRRPYEGFGSHSLEIFLSAPYRGSPGWHSLASVQRSFEPFLPPGFSSRRRVGVPRSLSKLPPLSTFFELFFSRNFSTF